MAQTTQPQLKAIEPPQGAQLAFIKSGALIKKFQAGQGGGKTVAGVFEVRRYVKRHAGAIIICTEPTYPMIRDILHVEFDRQFDAAGENNRVTYRASAEKYILDNGSEIWLRQCDQFDKLRGPSIAAAWMDEAGQCPFGAFQIICGRLRQPGYPHLFMCTGTPRGKNWFYWCFQKGERPDGAPPYIGEMLKKVIGEEPDQFSWGSLQNPYLDPVTKALLQSAYTPGTPMYEQEVLGKTVAREGLVYQFFSPDTHVIEPPEGLHIVEVVCGVDWGYANPGVILTVAMDAQGNIWVLGEECATEKSIKWWTERAQEIEKRHREVIFFCDPSEPANIAEFRSSNLRATKASNAIIPGITAVAANIGRGANSMLFVSPSCTHTIQEFGMYQWKERNGESVPDEPQKNNDHAMDALRYAVMALTRPSKGFIATG
ncbi:MAG: terminase family protein [Candidatus Paceibacterota bacterium]|jgi:PBSX family phage terminase large subunit